MDQDKSQKPQDKQQSCPPDQDIVSTHESQDDSLDQQKRPNKLRFWRTWTALECTQVVFNLLLVLVTATYTYFSYQQWQFSRESLQVTQRAYVGVHSIRSNLENGQIAVMLENIGKVPAQDIKVYANEARKIGDKIIGSSHSTFEAGHTHLFPGTFKTQVAISLKNLTSEEVGNILAGKEKLYISGKIQYGDGFGNVQHTDFAFLYTPPPNEGWISIPIVTFAELQRMNPEKENRKGSQ